jgi:hypothetical protein
MPVNMDPKRKRKPKSASSSDDPSVQKPPRKKSANPASGDPDSPTEADLAEKEWKNLWEATEVIDMDKW